MSRTGAKTHRVDSNAAEIVRAMRGAGISVESTAQVGGGFPDLLWHYRGHTGLMELKIPGEGLNAAQRDFRSRWPGLFLVAWEKEQAVRLVVELCRFPREIPSKEGSSPEP